MDDFLPTPITTVDIPSQPQLYPIWLQAGVLSHLGACIRSVCPNSSRWLVVTDETVGSLYGATVVNNLESSGFQADLVTLPCGEASKSLASLETLWQAAQHHGLTRHDGFIALGGGVVGDVTGFAAATYQRGVGFVQVPTTLLAMVDASVGGKVAIHQNRCKNNIGAFYQPHAVVMDSDTLKSLPSRQVAAGWAEIIKTALLETTAIPNDIAQLANLMSDHSLDSTHSRLLDIIARCIAVKQAVVAADPTESTGHRMILNLGHTAAHALETVSGFGLLHGEAVALGLRVACHVGEQLGVWSPQASLQMDTWLQQAKLPCSVSEVLDKEVHFLLADVLKAMQGDKKSNSSGLRWVIPTATSGQTLGAVQIRSDVTQHQIQQALTHIGIG
ncbi:MAG: 3-dehydroquinate synthase [Vampirovibrionales bacterium]|nr:3-dehydroquinate synthase [Vampirovibrionales bacterium]